MKRNWLQILVLLTFFLSCSGNITEPTFSDDAELVSKIIGTWSSDRYTITYYSNGTFVDTSFFYDENQVLKPERSTSGSYEIQDSVLYLKRENWHFFDVSRIENGTSIVPIETEISIENNVLYRKAVHVLVNVEGNNSEIWGTWKHISWTFHKSNPTTNIVYEGRQEYYYKFSRDSTEVTYGWKYLDGNPWPDQEFKSEFEYTPPFLDIVGPGAYDLRVEFKHEKMYWYLDVPVIQLNKVD